MMATVNMFPRITTNPKIQHGAPMIRDLPVPVHAVLARLAEGRSWDDLRDAYPGLEPQDIREALLYAAAVLHGAERRATLLEASLQEDRPILDALARHERTIRE
jgi:uncharacterized protein (DUF433 family)